MMKNYIFAVALCIALSACEKAPDETQESSVAGATSTVAEAAAPRATFRKTLAMQGITFDVEEGAGDLTVTPAGLEIANEPVRQSISGHVTNAEVADLDADGSPEVYVYLIDGEDLRASLVAYASNKRKSLSAIYLAPLTDDAKQSSGYQGRDEFAVLENRLGRRFPIVGTDGVPTGKMRQLQYKLVPGEASWQLALERSSDF